MSARITEALVGGVPLLWEALELLVPADGRRAFGVLKSRSEVQRRHEVLQANAIELRLRELEKKTAQAILVADTAQATADEANAVDPVVTPGVRSLSGMVGALTLSSGPGVTVNQAGADFELESHHVDCVHLPPPPDITWTGPLTNQLVVEFVFGGAGDYPAGMVDKLLALGSTSGAAGTPSKVKLKTVAGALLVELSIASGSALGPFSQEVFSNLPAGATHMQLLVDVPAGDTLLLYDYAWLRRR